MSRLHDMLGKAAGRQSARSSGNKKAAGRAAPAKGTGLFARLADLYERMQQAYADCAGEAGLTCDGCETNCCTSFFQHHTHIEWAYLWRGLHALDAGRRNLFVERAGRYVEEARRSMAVGTPPSAMCPLNEDGRCALYAWRLMICRMHGTRNMMVLPNGEKRLFTGCVRFTALPCSSPENDAACPTLDRTPFYRELAALETEFLQRARRPMPRVDLTLAEMIVAGPPRLQ